MIARPAAPHLHLRRRALGRPSRRRRGSRASRATPRFGHRGAGRPADGGGGRDDPLPHGRACRLRRGRDRHQACARTCACFVPCAPTSAPAATISSIVIDYPGFHVRVAEAARQAGIKVLYYIAPQLWAWRPGRARRFASAVDRLAVVLPFEQRFFGGLGLRSDYVGHPLVDRGAWPSRAAAREQVGIAAGRAGARALSREPARRRSAGSGGRFGTPRSSSCASGAAIGCWWRERPTATIPIPARSRSSAAIPSRSSRRRTRPSPSRAPPRSRPRSPTCRWWSRTRCIR